MTHTHPSEHASPSPEVELLKGALEIYSPSGQEKEVAEYFVEQMNDRGFDEAYVDEAGNAIGKRGVGKNVILYMGHIDTVPGVVPIHLHDDELWGRGACDAKGGMAAAIIAISELTEEDMEGKAFIVAGCVEEEIETSKGARYLLESMDEPSFVINGEPSGADGITLGYKGCFRFEYLLKQPITHHASSEPAANEHAFHFYRAVQDYLDQQEYKKQSAFYTPYIELRTWDHERTGLEESVHIKTNIRIPPNFDIDAMREFIESIQQPGTVTFTECIAGIELARSSYLARTFLAVMREKEIAPRCKVKTGSSDMNVVTEIWKKTEMLAYAPGDSSLDHTPDEHILTSEYVLSIEVLRRVLQLL